MFGQSFLISLVVRYLLQMGLPFLENFTAEKKALVKDWVYKQIPGSWADPVAWGIIESLWDVIISVAKLELGKRGVVVMGAGHPEVWPALGSAVSALSEPVKAAQAAA